MWGGSLPSPPFPRKVEPSGDLPVTSRWVPPRSQGKGPVGVVGLYASVPHRHPKSIGFRIVAPNDATILSYHTCYLPCTMYHTHIVNQIVYVRFYIVFLLSRIIHCRILIKVKPVICFKRGSNAILKTTWSNFFTIKETFTWQWIEHTSNLSFLEKIELRITS